MKTLFLAVLTLIFVAACTPGEGTYSYETSGDGYSSDY